jgi:glycosyltransferase involved in cell wall biosynthesis
MKVALVIYGSLETVSGGYLYDRMLVSKLQRRGDEVQVISQRRLGYGANVADNFRPSAFTDVDLLIQDELNHPSLFLANRLNAHPPIVSIVHHLRSLEHRASWQNAAYASIEKAYLQGVDGFIFNSETTRDTVRALIRRDKPHVVATPGGDRFGASTQEQVRARVGQSKTLRIITVGSVIPGKGLDVLLAAMHGLQSEDVALDVVGTEHTAPAFAQRMRTMAAALKSPITFHGTRSDAELHMRLQSADVFVLPSYYEGFGIVFLEAMAQGLPAIGVHAGAMPSLIRDGSNGYLLAPGDAGNLEGHLRAFARDRALLLRMSLDALSWATRFPSWDQSTERMRDFLVSVARAG